MHVVKSNLAWFHELTKQEIPRWGSSIKFEKLGSWQIWRRGKRKAESHNINSGICFQCRSLWSFSWSWKFGWRTKNYPDRNRCEKVIIVSLTLVSVQTIDYIPIDWQFKYLLMTSVNCKSWHSLWITGLRVDNFDGGVRVTLENVNDKNDVIECDVVNFFTGRDHIVCDTR